jgi:hypothetical protein
MRYLFSGAKSFNRSLTWYVDSLLAMDSMFSNSSIIPTTYITFTTSSPSQPWRLTSMQSAFESTQGATVNWSQWDTSHVTNMKATFRNASIIGISDIATAWNTATVTDMSQLFYNAIFNGVTTIPANILSWNTAAVTDMSYLFYGCQTFSSTSSVTYYVDRLVHADYMFANSNFSGAVTFSTSVPDQAWPLQSTSYMFYNVPSFSGFASGGGGGTGNISRWDTRRLTTAAHMFDCSTATSPGTFNQPLYWNVKSLVNASYMFANQTSLQSPIQFTTPV